MKKYCGFMALIGLVLLITSCGGSTADPARLIPADSSQPAVDSSLFLIEGLTSDIVEVDCTLSGGTETTCYRFSVAGTPSDHTPGPWCPRNIADSAEEGGIWLEGGLVYDIDGEFVLNLAEFYDDDEWQLYDETTGEIRVTDTRSACDAAARPDVEAQYNNYCVECLPSYMESETVQTYFIPVKPVVAVDSTDRIGGGFGVALNGIKFEESAPTDAILAAHTIAAFDDCGGHVNLNEGYHYHAVTADCLTEIQQTDSHAPMIGYALDGFPIYARFDAEGDEASGLDRCGGQYDDSRGYHYHVSDPGANMILGCLQGEYGCAMQGDATDQTCEADRFTFFGR